MSSLAFENPSPIGVLAIALIVIYVLVKDGLPRLRKGNGQEKPTDRSELHEYRLGEFKESLSALSIDVKTGFEKLAQEFKDYRHERDGEIDTIKTNIALAEYRLKVLEDRK